MHLSNNIRFLRKSKGLTQDQLAAAMKPDFDIVKSTVSGYEGGRIDPPLKMAVRLAAFFEISLQDLLYHDFKNGGDTRIQSNQQQQYDLMREIVDRLKENPVSMEWLKKNDHTTFVLLGGRN